MRSLRGRALRAARHGGGGVMALREVGCWIDIDGGDGCDVSDAKIFGVMLLFAS